MAQSVNDKALKKVLGDIVVIRYDNGYHVNPDGSGTKALHPRQEQAVINYLAYPETGGRIPLPDEKLARLGILFAYEGF